MEAAVTIDILTFRGTGEKRLPDGYPQGMLSSIVEPIRESNRASSFTFFEPEWDAEIGPAGGDILGGSLDVSVRNGVAAGIRAIQDSPNKVGILSYSLGGIVASLIAEAAHSRKAANRDGSPLEIAFVLNIANPLRRPGEAEGFSIQKDTFGLHGARVSTPGIPFHEYANPLDIITSSTARSRLRLIDGAISPFSFREGWRLGDVNAALQRIKDAEVGKYWWDAAWWKQFSDDFRGIIGYSLPFPWGDHVGYASAHIPGTDQSYTQHAVDLILREYS